MLPYFIDINSLVIRELQHFRKQILQIFRIVFIDSDPIALIYVILF
jgi:hypothetical protein